MNKVIITGVSGQDGSILAEMFLADDYLVVGIDVWNQRGLYPNLHNVINNPNFELVTGDISDKEFVYNVVTTYKPSIIMNMGAISFVPESFKIPTRVFEVNTIGVLNFLEVIKNHSPTTRFLQASTSEMLGNNTETPQNLGSRMLPNSPYAISKLASHFLVNYYRQAYGLFAVSVMNWNHESPRRGVDFVTRKIAINVANIRNGNTSKFSLGNLDSYRDWSYAPDVCVAMKTIIESGIPPDDYEICSGETHSVREFVEEAFNVIGMPIHWYSGDGLTEKAYDDNVNLRVEIDEKFYRPVEVPKLCGDNSKIKRVFNWTPSVNFKTLVSKMVCAELIKLDME